MLGSFDILSIILAFQCSYSLNYFRFGGFFFTDRDFLFLFLVVTPVWLLMLYLLNATEIPRTKKFRSLFFEYFLAAAVVLLLLIVLYFIFKLYELSRTFIVLVPFFGFVFLFFLRVLEYKVFRLYRAKGFNSRNLVLIADDSSLPFIESLLSNKEWGYRIAAIFTTSDLIKGKYEETIIILPDEYIEVLNDLMEVDMIDEVLYVKKKIATSEIRKVVRSCEELGVIFSLMHREEKLALSNAVKTEIADHKFLTFINVPHNTYALAVKKIIDIFGALLATVLLSPVFITVAIMIKSSSKGPVIYKQPRVGLRGRLFELYKFRSMVINADELKKNSRNKMKQTDRHLKSRMTPE